MKIVTVRVPRAGIPMITVPIVVPTCGIVLVYPASSEPMNNVMVCVILLGVPTIFSSELVLGSEKVIVESSRLLGEPVSMVCVFVETFSIEVLLIKSLFDSVIVKIIVVDESLT